MDAFPTLEFWEEKPIATSSGMTLRDYFAAKALTACVAAFMESGGAWDDYDDMAQSVWRIADAMLKAREA